MLYRYYIPVRVHFDSPFFLIGTKKAPSSVNDGAF